MTHESLFCFRDQEFLPAYENIQTKYYSFVGYIWQPGENHTWRHHTP